MDSLFQLVSPSRSIGAARWLSAAEFGAKEADPDGAKKAGTQDVIYVAPAATGVRLMGDFTNWEERLIPLRQEANGV